MARQTRIRQDIRLAVLVRKLRGAMPELRERYGVRTVGLFGSYVRGQQRAKSDLDILVDFERTPTLLEFVQLERHLSERLGVSVDLVMQSALKPRIGRRILEEVVAV